MDRTVIIVPAVVPSCSSHRNNCQEGSVERGLGSLPGGSSHTLCCKRAFQVDEGDTLFYQNAGLALLSDSCSLDRIQFTAVSHQVLSALVALLEKH